MANNQTAKVQIKEIAERLNISQSTVSVVLGGRAEQLRISKETQKRVQDMARELNYQPNIYARRLRHAADEEVPYVIALFWRQDNLNSRLGRFIQGLQNAIEKKQCKVELIVQPYKPGEFLEHQKMLSGNRISAAIVSGLLEDEQKELENMTCSVPVVVIGRKSDVFHCVTLDNYKAGEECLRAMLGAPIKTGGVIGFTQGSNAQKQMEAGFLNACRKENIAVDESWNVTIEKSSYENGYLAAEKILSNLETPAAVMVADCRLAGGITAYCNEHNVKIPQDLRIIFFEDSGILKYNKPPLSAVDIPASDMAEKALDILLNVLEKKVSVVIKRDILPLYYIRESSGR